MNLETLVTDRESAEAADILADWVAEASRLAAAHEGCHDMCAAAAIIRGYANLHSSGEMIPWKRLEDLMIRMRVCGHTGHFPKIYSPRKS